MDKIINIKTKAKLLAKKQNIKIKVALEILATKEGFENWKSYKNALDTYWYRKSSPFLNHWFAKHSDAINHQTQFGGYILTYKGQYFVAEKEYIAYIGHDPDDPIWKIINFDVSTSDALNKVVKVFKSKPLKVQSI